MSEEVPLRRCTKCGSEFPATTEFFYSQPNGKYGLKAECKICINKRNKPYVKNFYNRNKSELCEYQKALRQTPEGREYQKTYYQRPEVRERLQAWSKAYYAEHKEQEQISSKTYYAEHKEQFTIREGRRRSRKLAVTGTYTASQIRDLLKRQKHKCYYCSKSFQWVKGKYKYHIDHTFPLSRIAGTDIPGNGIDYLVLACPTCNHSKKDKFPWEFPEGGRLL